MTANFKTLLFFLFFTMNCAIAQTISTGAAINRAGKQRSLVIKMAKDYVAIGSGVKVETAMQELDEAASTFNENLRDLQIYSKNKETTDAINFTGVLWAKFRINVMQTPDVDSAEKIMNEANYLVNACNIVVDKIVLASGLKTAVLPNMCGKQRSYAQKLALLFFADKWQVPYKNIDKEIQENIVAFENGLTALANSPENTDEINAILKFQQSEWAFVKKSFENKEGTAMLGSIFSSTNMMLKDFDRAVTLYEKLVR